MGVVALIAALALGLHWAYGRSRADKVWGTYVTSLVPRTPEELDNIRTACVALHGRELPPGEEFSFNAAVGRRALEAGYQPATALVGAQADEVVGGGICQVSSTLYNAALLAGLTVVERHAHTRPVGSVPPGLDATVMYSSRDLRLQNPWDEPLVLRAEVSGQSLHIAIAGAVPRPFRATIDRRRRVLPATPDADGRRLDPGYEVTVRRRLLFADGHERRDLISSDIYPPASRASPSQSR